MDIVTLANQVIQALTPLMPILGGVGAGVGTAIINKFGEDVYDQGKAQGKRLYDTVKVRVEEEKEADNGKASKALQNFTDDPDEYEDVFKKRLLLLLQADAAFADRLEQILQNSPALEQIILLGKNAIAEDNEQSNALGRGKQHMELEEGAQARRNKQIISKPD